MKHRNHHSIKGRSLYRMRQRSQPNPSSQKVASLTCPGRRFDASHTTASEKSFGSFQDKRNESVNTLVPAQILDHHVKENCKQRGVAWKLACALAYAYLHQHRWPFKPVQNTDHAEGAGSRRKMLHHIRRSSSSISVDDPDLHVPVWQQHYNLAMPEIVNPTQAEQWLNDRFPSLLTY